MKTKTNKQLVALGIAGLLAASNVSFGSLTVLANTAKEPIKIVKKQPEFTHTSPYFNTKEEAENWLYEKENLLKNEYDIISKDIITLENQVISTSKVPIYYTFDSKESALLKKAELEYQNLESLNLKEEPIETITVNETFDSKEEALLFIENKKDKNDVKLALTEVYTDWISNGKTKVKEFSNLTKEELEKELNILEKELVDSKTDLVKYEIFVTDKSDTKQVYLKDNITTETKSYNTLEEAKQYIANLKKQASENIKITITGPIPKDVLVDFKNYVITKSFNTKEDANKYLESLEKEGYTLSNITKEEITKTETVKVPTENVIVNSSNKLNSNNSYEVKANYLMIKQASGKVVIWTKNALTEKEQSSFKSSWFKGNYDASVTEDFNIYFIHGEGLKDLSYLGKQWGTYNITENNGIIKMTCNKDRISHLNYGSFAKEYKDEEKLVTKYQVTGIKTMNTYQKEYEVNYQKTEKIYREETTYGALVEKETFQRDKNYQVIGSYNLNKPTWILEGKYQKNVLGNLHYAVIEANEKEETNENIINEITTINKKEINAKEKPNKEEIPKTGDNSDMAPALGLLAASSLVGTAVLVRKRKYNK